jgi:hypothetical protein
MNTQTEAERLADALVDFHESYDDEGPTIFSEAAAELRRLNFELQCANAAITARDKVFEANAELLEALKLADALLWGANMNALIVERKVKAAIAKHSKEQS